MKAGLKKRLLSLLLILVLMCGLAPTVLAEDDPFSSFKKVIDYPVGQFADVAGDDWFNPNVVWGYELGLIKGTSSTTFSPKKNITIAETITLAARLHKIYNDGYEDFVQGDPWFQVYVDYAAENGIIDRDDYSDYDAKATRAQFAYILAAAFPDSALEEFNDVAYGDIPDVTGEEYYGPDVYKLYRAGVLTGNDGYGTFSPDNNIKRSEVAAIVTRMAIPHLRKSFILLPNPDLDTAFGYMVNTAIESGEQVGTYSYRYIMETHYDAESGVHFTSFIDYEALNDTIYLKLTTTLPAQQYRCRVRLDIPRSPGEYYYGEYEISVDSAIYGDGSFQFDPTRLGAEDSIVQIEPSAPSVLDYASLAQTIAVSVTASAVDLHNSLLLDAGFTIFDLGFNLAD